MIGIDVPQWPAAGSDIARRVPEHDWATTPLGPIATWPAAWRTVVDLLLASGLPMVALWGPDLIHLYNDGYRDLMGSRHSIGLGQLTCDCWPEAWSRQAPIYDRVRSGETVTFHDAHYPVARTEGVNDGRVSLSSSPLRDETGDIAGMLVIVAEIMARPQPAVDAKATTTRYRSVFAATEQGSNLIEVRDDDQWRPIDYRFLKVNATFERQTGLHDVVGKRGSEITAGTDASWLEMYEQVLRTGAPHLFRELPRSRRAVVRGVLLSRR